MELVDLKQSIGSEYKYPDIIKFVEKHGRSVFRGSLKELDQYIDSFAAKKRIFLLRDKKGRLVSISCCDVLGSDLSEDPEGRVLYCYGVVVHKAIRDLGVMNIMARKWVQLFPKLEYIMFKRDERGGTVKVMPISKLLRRRL